MLVMAVFSAALAISAELLAHGPAYDEGASVASELAVLISLAILLLFPVVVLIVQWRLFGRGRECPSRLQLATILLATPMWLVVFGAIPPGAPDASIDFPVAALVCVPTTLTILLQGLWFRWRDGAELQGSAAAWTLLALGVTVAIVGFMVIVWGPAGTNHTQLFPMAAQVLTWVGLVAVVAMLIILVEQVAGPYSLPKSRWLSGKRTVSVVAAALLLGTFSWGLAPMLLAHPASTVKVNGDLYVITHTADYRQCFHRVKVPPFMDRSCAVGVDPEAKASMESSTEQGVTGGGQQQPDDQEDWGSLTENEWPGEILPEQIVARTGTTALAMVDSSLGQKGRFVSVQKTASGWQSGAVVAEGVSFVDLSEVDGVLFAAFSSDPQVYVVVSVDGGLTWTRANLQDSTIPADMREFRGVEVDGGKFVLTVGYPLWVDAEEAYVWTSEDGVTWSGPNKVG